MCCLDLFKRNKCILLHNTRGIFTLLQDNSEYTPGELKLSLSFYLFIFLYEKKKF